MQTETIISLAVAIAALLFTAFSYKRNATHDTEAGAAERATLIANVSYIRNAIDDIKLENRVIKKELDAMKEQVIRLEQEVQSAHKRLDDLKK